MHKLIAILLLVLFSQLSVAQENEGRPVAMYQDTEGNVLVVTDRACILKGVADTSANTLILHTTKGKKVGCIGKVKDKVIAAFEEGDSIKVFDITGIRFNKLEEV